MPKITAQKSRRVSSQRSKDKSWKSYKLFRRVKSLLSIFLLCFFALILSIGLISGYSFYKYLKAPLAASYQTTGELGDIFTISVIQVEDRYNAASKIKKLSYLVVNKYEKKVIIFDVPVELEMDLPDRYGQGTLSKVHALGELVEKNKGIDLANKALTKIFARKVDRYLLLDAKTVDEFSRIYSVSDPKNFVDIFALKNLFKAQDSVPIVKDRVEANLSVKEFLDLTGFFSALTPDQVKLSQVSQGDLLIPLQLDKKMESLFIDPKVVSEDKRIVVLNGAGVPKLGVYVSRFIEGFGGSVVSVDNASTKYEKSIIISDSLDSATLSLVSRQLGISNVVSSEAGRKMVSQDVVGADIVVIVGIDYASSL